MDNNPGFTVETNRGNKLSSIDMENPGGKPMNMIWLVVEPYPSEKWCSSSVGMMTIDILIYELENKKCLKPTNLLFYCKVGLVLQILASSLCQNATLTVGG